MKNKSLFLSIIMCLLYSEIASAKQISVQNIMEHIVSDMIIHPENIPPICAYADNYFKGKKLCFSSSDIIGLVLKNKMQTPKISQIITYQDVHSFTLPDSIMTKALQQAARVGKVTQPLGCDTACIITQKMVIPLSAIFSRYTQDIQNQERSVLLSFESSDNTFNISFNNYLDVTVDDGFVSILPPNSQQIDFPLRADATHISFLLSWYKNELLLSYLETAQGELLHLSPIVSMSSDDLINQQNIYLSIFNSDDRKPLTLQKVLMAVHNEPNRAKRGAAGIATCFLYGPLALYNIVTHGRCGQVESAWQHIKAFFNGDNTPNRVVAGTGKPLKPMPLLVTRSQELIPPTLALTQLNTQLHGQSLTLPAVAHHCQTPLDDIIGRRYPRQIGNSCSTWLSSVLADFTLLFGSSLRTWSTEYLIQTLNSILDRRAIDTDNDAIDAFIREPIAGNRLIQTITDVAEAQGRSALIDNIIQSFTHAEQNYAQYVLSHSPQAANHVTSSETSDASCSSDRDSDSASSNDSDIASPQQAQQYPLGGYQMPISSYVYQEILPRILQNGAWVVPQERFDIEIIQGTREETRHSIYALLEAIAEWENIYAEKRVYCDRHGIFSTAMETNRYAGQTTSQLIRSYARHSRQDQTIVVVRFNHRIISVSTAHSYLTGDNTERQFGVIGATLTHPAYVLTPQTEGTIRGAGSAALHAMIQHLQANSVTMLEAEVISTPSAIIKKRLGFIFVPDTYTPPLSSPTPPSHTEL
ncbi:hypothetical protein [Yersinia pekkanenii]|uniref:hypothetical protein n=1 Tax=Yersinia pekkanenii TaxID=1288385 RepID=UPI00066FD64C|nr:hypothetical protein [Yersinia pekkanenii]